MGGGRTGKYQIHDWINPNPEDPDLDLAIVIQSGFLIYFLSFLQENPFWFLEIFRTFSANSFLNSSNDKDKIF